MRGIIVIIVICILVWQLVAFLRNKKRIDSLKRLFPESDDGNIVVQVNNVTSIYRAGCNSDFKHTLNDINKYLSKNENKAFDYQIIKEIVERNSQSLEDEVDTMLSAPLYLGLMATIAGVVVGVFSFAPNLQNLISGSNSNGIKELLIDVGIAMLASFLGILFTKISTSRYNDAQTEMARCKNIFLSWIQSELMPKFSDSLTGALSKMANDLNVFNSTFANNTQELKKTLSTVNDNYDEQVKLLDEIGKLKITKIAKANIDVYDKLQGCTDELEKLFDILADSEAYLTKVQELNEKIGSVEERTRLFEELGNYFKNEIEYVKDRQGYMRQAVSELDTVLRDALKDLGESYTSSLRQLTTVFQTQNRSVQELIESQQKELSSSLVQQQQAVNEAITQFGNPFAGLKEVFEEGVNNIKESFAQQNTAIQEMLDGQKSSLENALKAQQGALSQKMKGSPVSFQELTEVSKRLNELDEKLSSSAPSPEKGWRDKITAYIMPVALVGTFVSLWVLILIVLCKL